MRKNLEMAVSIFRTATAVAFGVMSISTASVAQEVTQERIVSMLGKSVKLAPVIDVELLRQQAAANPSGNLAGLPDWAKLAKLSQMVVEISFQNDSVAMEPESYRTLGMLADALHHPNLSKYSFLVVGHTSSTGDAKHNLDLSEARANAIKEALSTTFAVPATRLYAVGAGEEFPIQGSDPAAAQNRRVQLFNLGMLK